MADLLKLYIKYLKTKDKAKRAAKGKAVQQERVASRARNQSAKEAAKTAPKKAKDIALGLSHKQQRAAALKKQKAESESNKANQENLSNWQKMYGPRARASVRAAVMKDRAKGPAKRMAERKSELAKKTKKRAQGKPSDKKKEMAKQVAAPVVHVNKGGNAIVHIPGFPIGENKNSIGHVLQEGLRWQAAKMACKKTVVKEDVIATLKARASIASDRAKKAIEATKRRPQ